MKRRIIKIDEDKCTGCGICIPDCPEGALQIIDGKARLISDLFCDGLGACIKACPENAMEIEEREAEEYDESKVMENIVKGGVNVIKAHLEHLRDHGEDKHRPAEYGGERYGVSFMGKDKGQERERTPYGRWHHGGRRYARRDGVALRHSGSHRLQREGA